jgi:hypothetical protein
VLDGCIEPSEIKHWAQTLPATKGGEGAASAARGHVHPDHPPPQVEGVRIVVDGGVEVHAAEVDVDALDLGDEDMLP